MCAAQGTCVCACARACPVTGLIHGVLELVCISSQEPIPGIFPTLCSVSHVSSLKLVRVRVLIPRKSANITN